jgi:hypothetical protein
MRPAIQLRTQSSLTRPLGLAALCFLIGLGLVVWFGNIALRTLTEPDEARYAEIAREMLATGDWVTPHLNGIAYFEKPPLQYWATAVAYSVFGAQPWVARLWTTGFGLLGLVLTYATAKKLWGVRTAEHAALLLASFPLYFIVTHLNLLDGALAFFLNAAVCAFVVAKQPDTPLLARRRLLYLCWFALALGFLQKGLVALVLPFLALTTYSLLYRDSRLWREMQLRAGLAILAAVTLPWTTLVASRNPGFLEFFFVHEQFTRFLTTVHDRYQPWWYFIAVLIAGVSPWLVVAVRTTIHAVRRRAITASRATAADLGNRTTDFLLPVRFEARSLRPADDRADGTAHGALARPVRHDADAEFSRGDHHCSAAALDRFTVAASAPGRAWPQAHYLLAGRRVGAVRRICRPRMHGSVRAGCERGRLASARHRARRERQPRIGNLHVWSKCARSLARSGQPRRSHRAPPRR